MRNGWVLLLPPNHTSPLLLQVKSLLNFLTLSSVCSHIWHTHCKPTNAQRIQTQWFNCKPAISRNHWDKLLQQQTHCLFITQGFDLLFLLKILGTNRVWSTVLKDLVHFIILYFFSGVCCDKMEDVIFSSGSVEFAKWRRAWETFWLLHVFITDYLAVLVVLHVFKHSLGHNRYFMEIHVCAAFFATLDYLEE